MNKIKIIRSNGETELCEFVDILYFYMLNFTVTHEFGHIAHGHLREINGENNIDEIFQVVGGINEEEKREKIGIHS